ncbi:MAG: hypothetical protein Q8O67_32690 [Deltaproteobacteria bacterium]|nr:hypothetical protein [Deltaproteobacteria bacterium]
MLKQLPTVLADPFAFEAMRNAMGGKGLHVEQGPAAVATSGRRDLHGRRR